jgi:hypothetical protein
LRRSPVRESFSQVALNQRLKLTLRAVWGQWMAVTAEVMQLVGLLDEEGFGALAGELLMEISLGSEKPVADGYISPAGASDGDDDENDPDVGSQRIPIPDKDQLRAAAQFLRLRIVEPIRRLAEAERIAGELSSGRPSATSPRLPAQAAHTRIEFVDTFGDTVTAFTRTEAAGDQRGAEELDQLLVRIAAHIV